LKRLVLGNLNINKKKRHTKRVHLTKHLEKGGWGVVILRRVKITQRGGSPKIKKEKRVDRPRNRRVRKKKKIGGGGGSVEARGLKKGRPGRRSS